MVVAGDGGVTHGLMTAFDAALLALAGPIPELVDEGLPEGWGRTLVAPLEADGRRLGVLVLVGHEDDLQPRDLAVLGPLVSALAVALRGADHLTKLVEETDKLQAVVDHSSDGILVLDAESRVQVWSPSMEVLSGLPASLAVGRPLLELLHCRLVDLPSAPEADGSSAAPGATGDGDGELTNLLEVATLGLTAQEPRRTVEVALVRPDGEERWVRMSHNAVFETDSEIGLLAQDVVLLYDVTPGAAGGAAEGRLHRHRVPRAANADHADQGLRRTAAQARRGDVC